MDMNDKWFFNQPHTYNFAHFCRCMRVHATSTSWVPQRMSQQTLQSFRVMMQWHHPGHRQIGMFYCLRTVIMKKGFLCHSRTVIVKLFLPFPSSKNSPFHCPSKLLMTTKQYFVPVSWIWFDYFHVLMVRDCSVLTKILVSLGGLFNERMHEWSRDIYLNCHVTRVSGSFAFLCGGERFWSQIQNRCVWIKTVWYSTVPVLWLAWLDPTHTLRTKTLSLFRSFFLLFYFVLFFL